MKEWSSIDRYDHLRRIEKTLVNKDFGMAKKLTLLRGELSTFVFRYSPRDRGKRCTCDPRGGVGSSRGCRIHCTHYGISPGGICYYGEEDVN